LPVGSSLRRLGVQVTRTTLAAALAAGMCVLVFTAGCSAGGSSGSASASATADGATLVNGTCGRCHPIDRVQSAHKDRAGWTATVDRMVSHGAPLNEAQKAAVVDYLTRRDGGQ
jgi:hypothetical protein